MPARQLLSDAFFTTTAHRVLPRAIGLRLAATRAERAWQDPYRRRVALRQMQFLVGRSPLAAKVPDLAYRWWHEFYKRAELRWRPWLVARQEVVGVGGLRAAAERSGVLLAWLHQGQFDGLCSSLARQGLQVTIAAHPDNFVTADRGVRQQLRTVGRDATVLTARGGFRQMQDMLADKQILALASDIPGSRDQATATILGRPVVVATGGARLAHSTGAQVAVVVAHRRGALQYLEVQAPFGARDFVDVDDLHREIFRRHERAISAWPEGLEDPFRRWHPTGEDVAAFADDIALQ